VLAADAADPTAMADVVRQVRARFGAIHGVVHAAGLLDARAWRTLRELSAEECERQLRPKVQGARVLGQVLEGESPDFVLLMSSLSAVLGGIGYGAYAAGNAFLDAFAEDRHQRGQRHWISVNWDSWQATGPSSGRRAVGELERLALTTSEALEALDRILDAGRTSRVVVSTADLGARLLRWSRPAATEDPSPEVPAARHPRPSLQTSYVAPEGEADVKLARIWSDVLGIDRVGLHDNFFELGGTSLLAIQMVARARQVFEAELSVAAVFEGPTVHSLGRLIRSGAREPGTLVSAGSPGGRE